MTPINFHSLKNAQVLLSVLSQDTPLLHNYFDHCSLSCMQHTAIIAITIWPFSVIASSQHDIKVVEMSYTGEAMEQDGSCCHDGTCSQFRGFLWAYRWWMGIVYTGNTDHTHWSVHEYQAVFFLESTLWRNYIYWRVRSISHGSIHLGLWSYVEYTPSLLLLTILACRITNLLFASN